MNVALSETKLTPRQPEAGSLDHQMGALLAVLLRLIDHQGSIVIHITAARSGEGTTTIARQLAAAAARSKWCKVALVDGHRESVGEGTGAALKPRGLVETFDETGTIQLRRQRIGEADMAVGTLNTNWELTPKVETVRALYAKLRGDYTLTVVDCPAVIEWRDTAALASVADGTILVVEAERTRVTEIERARELLDQLGATLLGVVFNKRRNRVPRFVSRFL